MGRPFRQEWDHLRGPRRRRSRRAGFRAGRHHVYRWRPRRTRRIPGAHLVRPL